MPPLEGITVLDLSRVLAGPWCTMTLADLGAEVWKIESPADGDDTRGWRPPEVGGESTYYLCANRNKKSLAINLKTPEGAGIVRRLAAQADVLDRPDLAEDPRFRRNRDRVVNRGVLIPLLAGLLRTRPTEEWIRRSREAGVPAGVVRELPEVFSAPETIERGLVRRAPHPTAGEVALVASPLRLSDTPVRPPAAPPLLGQHTVEVLSSVLGADAHSIGTGYPRAASA